MAGNIGDLQVNLSANTSQMERDVSAALKRLETKGFNFGAGINSKAFTQPLGRITGASNEFQKSLDASNARVIAFGASAGAIYIVQRAFTSLITSTIEVQKSLTDINVILGTSQKTLGQFGDSLFEIAKNSGQAFSTVATAAGELARQGLSVEQTLKRTSDALILARLSGLDAASSVEALTASINSFNSSALDSTQIVNKLASVDAAFAVSSGDLAEALKRVGSSAQDVGVTFDELLAIVASVNQTTARGGAVIGNSLKTIFTRVQRTDVLDQLESLGLAVRDLNGNTAPAIQILTGLAGKFDELGAAQKSQVAELVGGVFQINILKAALGDLSKEYSVYGNALKTSEGATDEAIRRNAELNKTLAALLNKTVANLTRVGSDIGSLSFAPAIEKVLGGINTALESFDIKGDGIGSKIGKGIFEGIGSFISGPGLALLIGVFIKLFGNLAKFTTDAVRTVLGLNKEAQAQAQIQERINTILAQNPQLIQNIVNKQVSLLQVEKDILTVIQAQSQARQQSTAIAASLTRGLIGRGVTSEKGVITAKTKSQGFIPNFNANQEMMGAISGGYMPGQVRSMNIPNYGRVTYNDAETVKQFSGLSQPGIMPPADSEAGKAYKQKFKDKYGINPYASSGFVPNFAGERTKQRYPYVAVKSTDRKALSKQFKASEEADASDGYTKATKKGNIVNSKSIDRYGYIYPSFSQSSPGRAVGMSSGKKYGFTTYPFPGGNFDINENLYETVRQNLINTSSDYFKQLITQPKILDTTRFKTNISSNLSRSAVESSLGQVFEAGIKSSISSLSLSETANFDLSKSELSDIQQKFQLPYGGFGNTYLADLKNSLSEGNLNSMAGKISTASGEKFSGQDTIRAKKTQSLLQKEFTKEGYEKLSGAEAAYVRSGKFKNQGFIPNFSPIDRALKTEKKMGGRGVLDFKPGLGLYVRDGETQPNFAAVMRDHPEGIGNAVQNSKKMQSSMSAGFIPNFAGFDPMSLFYIMQSMGGSGGAAGAESELERGKLDTILRDRRAAQDLLKAEEAKEIKDQTKINYLKNEQRQLLSEENKQKRLMNSQMGVFARDQGGKISGGFGGALGRFGSRYGAGLALGAPLLADTAAQFIGNENTAGGRATKAGVSGLGTAASYAGLGFSVGGPIGAAIGGGAGLAMGIYDVFQKLNDIMPDVARRLEVATEKFNNVSAASQTMSVSLETLSSIEGRADLSAQTRVQLRVKAEEDFAKSIAQLDQVLPGAGKQITDLYTKIGDTAELRQKIIQLQTEAQKESKGLAASANLYTNNQKLNDTAGPTFLQKLIGAASNAQAVEAGIPGQVGAYDEAAMRAENIKGLKGGKKHQYDDQIRAGANQLDQLFANFGKNGPLSSEEISKLQAELKDAKGLDGIKKVVEAYTANGTYATIVAENLNDLTKSGFADPIIQAFRDAKMQAETIQKEIANENQKLIGGQRKITDIEAYGRAFGGQTPISAQALGGIDYSSLGEQANISRGQAFGESAKSQFSQLMQEVGYSSENVQKFSQYNEEAANIQKDLINKTITLSQATERLKLIFDKVSFEQNAKNMFSGERASARQGILEGQLKQGKLAEGFDPLTSFFDKFGDNAATTADKINKSFGNLAENMQTGFEDAFGAFLDGTKTADDAMRSMLLSISQQIIKEQFSIGMRSIIGGVTGGGGYGSSSGQNGGGILGSILGLFGGGKAQGGIIRKYSAGGHVEGGSGVRDDVPAMLTDGEYVLRKSAVNKYGKGTLDMLNSGGMVKGYASGGSINSSLSNSYDFFGSKGEKLTENYTPEAFKTTVNAPSELANIPALTGKFNISDMLSSRALMDEGNPMNALRNQRFLEMQGYQEQVSNFKTGYNEQYYQVEQQRKEAQRAADEENSRRMSAYNSQRSQMLIGGLMSAGMSLFGGLSGGGFLGGGLQSFMGGGGGGGGGGGIGGSLLSGLGNIFSQGQQAASYGKGMSTSMGTQSAYQLEQIKKSISDSIEGNQFSGYGDPFSKRQSQLFPQFGGQSGFTGAGFGGMNFGQPTSSIGGFQYGVGLGSPAGFQTQTQTKQDYLMNFASPTAPIAPGRGNLVYDFLNQNSNPFGYQNGYAKGGRVKRIQNFEEGGYVQVEFDKSSGKGKMIQGSANFYNAQGKLIKSIPVNSGGGSAFPTPQGEFNLDNFRSRSKNALGGGMYSGGVGYSMDVKNKDNYDKSALSKIEEKYLPIGTSRSEWKNLVKNNDFMWDPYANRFRGEIRLHPDDPNYGGGIGTAGCVGTFCPEDQAELSKMLKTGDYSSIRVRYGQNLLNKLSENGLIAQSEPGGLRPFSEKTMLAENVRPKVNPIIAGLNLPSRNTNDLVKKPLDEKFYAAYDQYMKDMPLPKANLAGTNTTGPFATKSPIMYSSDVPDFTAKSASFDPSTFNPSPFNMPQGAATNKTSSGGMKMPAIGGGAGGIGGALMASLGGMKNLAGKGYDALYDLGGNLYDKSIFNPDAGYQTKMSFPMGEGPKTKAANTIPENLLPQDLLNPNKQSAEQILPFFQNLADMASENKQSLYQSVGSLYDMKNKGDYGRLSSKFSSFYGNDSKNRYSSFGEKGFNNYLKYIGADPYSSMSSLNSFKFPMTPNTYSPFAFGSQNFGGFGGSGYQSGFSSTGNAFSNYFSTGSRLGITPSWASRAAGGMIYGGTSTKDDVPAMLMGGEYVIRKDVVDRMGEPFFNSLNRGKPQGFAEGGPVGTGLPSVVGGGSNQQDNSRGQFVDSITKLVKSLEQLNKGIEEQNKDSKMKTNGESESSDSSSSGVTNNISINVNVDQNGKTTDSKKEEDQSGGGSKEETDQEKFKKTMEKSRILAELLRQQVLKTIVEEQRPGGVLYGGSKGRDMGR